ncbi:MAG TPA: ABC transporter permease [Pyrinomonadaceae bacterium]|nr:ABC transporter permease [Pyrinomonadaceae bacterium]
MTGERTIAAEDAPAAKTYALPSEPVVANDAQVSLGVRDLRDLWRFRELLYFLTWRDIKVRYKQTVMGASWAIIQPLVMMLVFAVFFGLLRIPTDHTPHLLFFYCGLLPWTFFANAVTQSSVSLVTNSNLITKVYFPRVLIPAATIGACLVDLAVASVILFGLMLYYGFAPGVNLLMLPALVLLTLLLALGLGTWLAALMVKYRDVRHVLPFVFQVWFFLTPIIYPASVVPERWRWVLHLNPMAGVVEGVRASVTGRPFDWGALAFSAAATAAVLACSVYAFNRLERSFADVI